MSDDDQSTGAEEKAEDIMNTQFSDADPELEMLLNSDDDNLKGKI